MKVDMSAKAVSERLRLTSELRQPCLALAGDRLRKIQTATPHGMKDEEVILQTKKSSQSAVEQVEE